MPQRPKAHLIDTNILVRYLVGDHPAQASRAAALMERLEAGTEKAEVLESVVAETVWTLESFYEVPRPEIASRLAAVLTFPGVRTTRKGILLAALARFGSVSVDFVDCLLAASSERRSMPVYSFDTDFRRLAVDWEPPE